MADLIHEFGRSRVFQLHDASIEQPFLHYNLLAVLTGDMTYRRAQEYAFLRACSVHEFKNHSLVRADTDRENHVSNANELI